MSDFDFSHEIGYFFGFKAVVVYYYKTQIGILKLTDLGKYFFGFGFVVVVGD